MPTKSVLFINDDPVLAESLRKASDFPVVSERDASRLRQKYKNHSFSLIILEKRKDCLKDLKRLLENGRLHEDCCLIVASDGLLRPNADRIREILPLFLDRTLPHPPAPQGRVAAPSAATSAPLAELMENKLPEFVRQMKLSGGRNLLSLLRREIEPPLIRLALKETNGNQIQAAHLLGVNRNTLRKKIRALKITVGPNGSPRRRRNSA